MALEQIGFSDNDLAFPGNSVQIHPDNVSKNSAILII